MTDYVMIVDDDPSVLVTVRNVLKSSGIGCASASSGPRCLEALSKGFRGVILLDVMMPLMDGWETLRAMERRGLVEGNVVCMLTAVRNPPPEAADLKDRVLDYMRKPFEADDLVDRVREYMSYLDRGTEGPGESAQTTQPKAQAS
jgi:DNA-binding NtrC family response regulator